MSPFVRLRAIWSIVPMIGVAACAPPRSPAPAVVIQPAPVIGAPDLEPEALPDRRHGHRMHDVKAGLIVFGGFGEGSPGDERGTRATFAFDSGRRAWRRLPDMHAGKAFFSSAVVDDAIWAIGTDIERFDPVLERWEIVCRDERLPGSHFAAAAVGRAIYVVGAEVLVFDVGTRTLARIDPWPGRRSSGSFHDHFHVVAVLDDTLHVIGGLDGNAFQPMNVHWVMRGGVWSRLPDAPQALFAKFAVVQVVGHTLYFFTSGSGLSYDGRRAVWTTVAGMPSMLVMPASFARGGWIHVLGGMPVEDGPTRLSYEIATDRWVIVPAAPR
jgi:hypothetical protein